MSSLLFIAVFAAGSAAPAVAAPAAQTRICGADRHATAAALELSGWPSPDAAPAPTLAALEKLAPSFVMVLGGTSAASPAAFEQLAAKATGYRLAGPDRYATAATVLTDFHTSAPADGSTPSPSPRWRGWTAPRCC